MTPFFNPATAVMRGLRVSRKFIVAGAPALLLLLVLGAQTLIQLNQRVGALESKRFAVDLMTDLIDWNKALIEGRRLSIPGGPDSAAALTAFRAEAARVSDRLAQIELKVAAAIRRHGHGRRAA